MGRWILKVNDSHSTADLIKEIENVVAELTELNMIIFDATEDVAEQLYKNPKVAYVVRDATRNALESCVNEYDDTDTESTIYSHSKSLSSTEVGVFGSGKEHYSHLELINKRNFNTPRSHEYSPTRTGKGVDCYIVDTGVNFNHPYLKGRVNRISNFTMNLDSKNDSDDNGHGTYSALFLAGKKCGVAQDAMIYSLKVISRDGSGYNSNILIGINAAISHHLAKTNSRPSVLNYSVGMMPSVDDPTFVKDVTGSDYPTLDGLKMATHKGMSTTTAAGNGFLQGSRFLGPMMSTLTNGQMNLTSNESDNFDKGQGLPIVVGSTQGISTKYETNPNKMAIFSNYGEGNTINIAGSALVIPSRYWNGEEGDTYVWKNGTSFSCPIVAGLIALHLEENPTATPTEVRKWLIDTGTKGIIENLMIPISLAGGNVILEQGSSIGIINSLDGFAGEDWSVVQIKGVDGNYLLGFDDWYDVVSMTPNQILFDFGNSSEIDLEMDGDKITISMINGTHESTDGIKKWQNRNANNRITQEQMNMSDTHKHIGAVEYTDNLVAYNPHHKLEVESATSTHQSSITINTPIHDYAYSHDTTTLFLQVSISGSSHGHWHWRLNSWFPSSGMAGGNMVMSANSATITGLTDGTHTVNVALVTANHEVLSSGDSVTFTIDPKPFDIETFNSNKETWESSNIKNYSFNFNWGCYCLPEWIAPVTIEVLNGSISKVTTIANSTKVELDDVSYYTLSELFGYVKDAYDDNAYKIEASYDESGYLTDGYIDFIRDAVDDEMGFSVSDFKILEPEELSLKCVTSAGTMEKTFSASVGWLCDNRIRSLVFDEPMILDDTHKTLFLTIDALTLSILGIEDVPEGIVCVTTMNDGTTEYYRLPFMGDTKSGDFMYSFTFKPVYAITEMRMVYSDCICPTIWQPVCGYDNQTYSNECNACCSGVGVDYSSECSDS